MSTALKRYSVKEYLERERSAETKSEYLDGEIFAMAGASLRHNAIVTNIVREASLALKETSCQAFPSDLRVVSPSGLYTYPDASIVCGSPQISRGDLLENPVVIFEVLSDSTEAYDRGRKFAHYRTIESLREYVLIAQDQRSVEHFRRGTDDEWILVHHTQPDERLQLESARIEIPLNEIYRNVSLPEVS